MSSRILDSPRKLTVIEQMQLLEAKEKWHPKIIQTYKTTLFEMIANPYKKALFYLIVFSILVLLLISVISRYKLRLFYNKIIIGIIIIVTLSIFSNVALQNIFSTRNEGVPLKIIYFLIIYNSKSTA